MALLDPVHQRGLAGAARVVDLDPHPAAVPQPVEVTSRLQNPDEAAILDQETALVFGNDDSLHGRLLLFALPGPSRRRAGAARRLSFRTQPVSLRQVSNAVASREGPGGAGGSARGLFPGIAAGRWLRQAGPFSADVRVRTGPGRSPRTRLRRWTPPHAGAVPAGIPIGAKPSIPVPWALPPSRIPKELEGTAPPAAGKPPRPSLVSASCRRLEFGAGFEPAAGRLTVYCSTR